MLGASRVAGIDFLLSPLVRGELTPGTYPRLPLLRYRKMILVCGRSRWQPEVVEGVAAKASARKVR